MQEKTIERYLARRVKDMGGWALKLYSPNVSGLPDRLILLPGGKVAFTEVKRPNATPRPLQVATHRRLQELGFAVSVIDCKAAADDLIKTLGGDGE